MAVTPEQIALVRLYIADLGAGDEQLLTDEQLTVLLDANGEAVRLAAADALEAIAASEVLVSKKIRTQTLTTDGPAVSAELRALAARQRQLHAEAVDADDEGFFDVVDTVVSYRRPELTEHGYSEFWGL
jgi:hypothetical protein